jgi:hypothetical protein
MDSGANTTCMGWDACIVEHVAWRTVGVAAYNNELVMENEPIFQGRMATDLPDDTIILLRSHESTDLEPTANMFFSPL